MTRTIPRACRRAGFTLVELMAALMIGGLVLAAASRFLSVLSDGRMRLIESDGRSLTALDPAAYRWLRRAFESLEAGTEARSGFTGDSTRVEFTARIPDGRGVTRRRRIRLTTEGGSLVHAVDGSPGAPLATGLLACGFRFVQGPAFGPRMTGWYSPSTAPVAVELVLIRRTGSLDTLLFTIGGRG